MYSVHKDFYDKARQLTQSEALRILELRLAHIFLIIIHRGDLLEVTIEKASLHSVVLLSFLGLFLMGPQVSAQSLPPRTYLLAQTDPDEAYDPFSDYSEFDEASDEEADINFFKNGRFFTVGLSLGTRGFTDNMSSIYSPAPVFGVNISYFFDLRLAFNLGLMSGDSAMNFKTVSGTPQTYTGTLSLTSINMDLKYYMNTQNVTRGLADLNPYVMGGFSRISRTQSIPALDAVGQDSPTMGVDLGLGLEIPLLRRKSFFGVQLAYHYVNFSDESKDFVLDSNQSLQKLEKSFSGDFYDLVITLGMNF